MDTATRERLAASVPDLPGLQLLLLIGSQARGEAHEASDVDLGYLAGASFDPGLAVASWASALGRDDVDVVDLRRASALLRQRAADMGSVLWQDEPGRALAFREEAALFWADAQWVIEEAHHDVLKAL